MNKRWGILIALIALVLTGWEFQSRRRQPQKVSQDVLFIVMRKLLPMKPYSN